MEEERKNHACALHTGYVCLGSHRRVLANSPQPWKRKRKCNFSYVVTVKSYVCICVSRLRAVCSNSLSQTQETHAKEEKLVVRERPCMCTSGRQRVQNQPHAGPCSGTRCVSSGLRWEGAKLEWEAVQSDNICPFHPRPWHALLGSFEPVKHSDADIAPAEGIELTSSGAD